MKLVNQSYLLDNSAVVSHTLLVIFYIKPPVIDIDAIVKPSIVISGGFISTSPLLPQVPDFLPSCFLLLHIV